MNKEIETIINAPDVSLETKLNGNIDIKLKKGKNFVIGKSFVAGAICIKRPNIVIDGGNSVINLAIDGLDNNTALFFVEKSAKNVCLKNIKINIIVNNNQYSNKTVYGIYNLAHSLKLVNCSINIYSEKHVNMIGIYNNGSLDTALETKADNFVVENCCITVKSLDEFPVGEAAVYGIYNNFANSIAVSNSFIYSTINGNGEKQRAIGLFTNGRYGRFVGNNIKANGTHNIGRKKEQAHVVGFENYGAYSLIVSNNIVGEWSGKSIGLYNNGEYGNISSNKILATHTICGRSIINRANHTTINSNIITTTSKNGRLLDFNASECVVSKNIMEVIVGRECVTACGIYAMGEGVNNIITENVVTNVKDCALIASKKMGLIQNNILVVLDGGIREASEENIEIINLLDEKNIYNLE